MKWRNPLVLPESARKMPDFPMLTENPEKIPGAAFPRPLVFGRRIKGAHSVPEPRIGPGRGEARIRRRTHCPRTVRRLREKKR